MNNLVTKGFKISDVNERYIAAYLIKLPENLDSVTDDLMLHRYLLILIINQTY
jgi:hypothetical protein